MLDPDRDGLADGRAPDLHRAPPLLSLVVPTYNERGNIAETVHRTARALEGVAWEIIFVDDNSPDGTWAEARDLAGRDPRVRCLRRIARRGLSGACIEGILSASAPFVAVMDADLQHDAALLPRMLDLLLTDTTDVVVGSRHVEGGSSDEGFSPLRRTLSDLANRFGQLVLHARLGDPMSGFFMIRRERFDAVAPHLTQHGFKILADILSSTADLRVRELGYAFRPRVAGESKLGLGVSLDFLGLILNKLTAGLIPVRFLFFVLSGTTGLAVHLVTLRTGLALLPRAPFATLQGWATLVAMTSNFFVNNFVTYRDRKLRGLGLLRGLCWYYAVCGIGAAANVALAAWFYDLDNTWWVAGVAGALMSAVWNYALSTNFVWR